MKIMNVGGRMIPVGLIRVGERVIAYNPHLHPIAREGNVGEILPQSEMPVFVTDYYLGCFARGALFALGLEKEPPQGVSLGAQPPKEEILEKAEANIPRNQKLLESGINESHSVQPETKSSRKKKEKGNHGESHLGSFSAGLKEKP